MDKKVSIVPGSWLLHPPNFIPIEIEGELSQSGDTVFGVVPKCSNGAFVLHRDPDAHDGTVEHAITDLASEFSDAYFACLCHETYDTNHKPIRRYMLGQ